MQFESLPWILQVPARTRRLAADLLRKSRRDLAVDLRSPHCLRAKRAFAIAIVTRRAETPVGWLGEERSDDYSAGRRHRPYAISTLISHSSAKSCRASEGPAVANPK